MTSTAAGHLPGALDPGRARSSLTARRELEAAGIDDPTLAESYLRCRYLNAQHGKTYFLATALLPPAKRPFVHALYGFARYADEIVDDMSADLSVDERAEALARFGDAFLADLSAGRSSDPVCAAVVDTATRWRIPRAHFEAFLDSMAMDLTVTDYPTYPDLYRYVYGSAAVIGLQMVPILEPEPGQEQFALERATDLGVAFQLANFIRDVSEDLGRGRVYLPADELAAFGVDRDELERCRAAGSTSPAVRQALIAQSGRVRALGERSREGIAVLHPSSQPCIEAARVLYCGIVDEVERQDYDVFVRRASVSVPRRVAVALPAWTRSLRARREYGPGAVPATIAADRP